MLKNRIKIAVIHSWLKAGGGSEAVALWTIEALKDEYDVTLITMVEPNFEILNKCYGTQIYADQILIKVIPIPYLLKIKFDALKNYRLVRYCQKKCKEYDVLISSYNVMGLSRKAIQIIGDFSFDDRLRRSLDYGPNGIRKLFYVESPIRWAYLKLGELLSGNSKKRWEKNITIANSEWSRKLLFATYNLEALTIYPPVQGPLNEKSWDDREDGFVCLGRITPEKGIDHIIDILFKVRDKGWNIHLHILGAIDNSQYGKRIYHLWEKNRKWIILNGPLFGKEKMDVLSDHKYGISARKNEPFGIAVAEMVKSGNLVWVPNGGGQMEIVGNDSLIYSSTEDAVRKIHEVLQNSELRNKLRDHLHGQSNRFSIEKYQLEIRNLIVKYLTTKQSC